MKVVLGTLNNTQYLRPNKSMPLKNNNKISTVSFSALPIKFFKGIELNIIDKFNPPIDKMNDYAECVEWCKKLLLEVKTNKIFTNSIDVAYMRAKK